MESIHESWKPIFEKHNNIIKKLEELYNTWGVENIYPRRNQVFRVFEMNVEDIQILLLGQDPYHRSGQAHGLSFSVCEGVKIPPSLKNIYKELQRQFPERNYVFNSGNLEQWWSREKIFLLNAALTVLDGKPGCHMNIWKDFTNDVIKYIAEKNNKCIFLLLGNFAKEKAQFIDGTIRSFVAPTTFGKSSGSASEQALLGPADKSRILTCVHPSPLAQGFVGSGIFQKVEEQLEKNVDWSI
jgi:uracil-DNA glycosylase